jgi:two-component sensor histidine kinase
VNNAMMSLLKVKNKGQILGRFVMDFITEEQRKKATRNIWQIYARRSSASRMQNYTITDFENNRVEIEIKSVLIKFNNKNSILSLVNNLSEKRQREKEKQKMITVEAANRLLEREIKERKEAEKNLTEMTAHLSSIFESSTHLLWTVDKDYRLTSFNKNFIDAVKQERGVEVSRGLRVDELLIENAGQYRDFWYARYEEAFNGLKLEFEHESFNEGKFFRKVFINPVYNNKNEIIELSCIANDITDSKIYEQKLLSQTGKLTAIFDSSHHYIWTINHEEKLTSFNKNYYDLVTALYNTKPYVGLVLDRGVLSNDKEYTMVLKYHYNKAFNGVATSFEIETRDQDLKNIYLEIFLNPIYENDKVVEVSGIAHNITEKKLVQQRIEVSLKEKEVLLREVHHRVKNNMQVISSILNLQSSYVSDENTLNLLKESQNRIKTMAYIHESLYQNKSFSSVNFSDYVSTLVKNIVQSYSYSGDKVQVELNIQYISLSLDCSIPAGLIINELITNAIKHAFPGTRKGLIIFNLRSENNLVILELKDNGVGFAQGVDFENSHSLGLQLVNTLTEQIDVTIIFKS